MNIYGFSKKHGKVGSGLYRKNASVLQTPTQVAFEKTKLGMEVDEFYTHGLDWAENDDEFWPTKCLVVTKVTPKMEADLKQVQQGDLILAMHTATGPATMKKWNAAISRKKRPIEFWCRRMPEEGTKITIHQLWNIVVFFSHYIWIFEPTIAKLVINRTASMV